MARRISRKEMKHDEFVETAVEAGHWLEENWPMVVKGAIALAVLAAVIGFVFWQLARSRDQAEELLARGIGLYQQAETTGFALAGDLEAALALFEESAGKTGSGAAGQSARYYQGASLLQLGRADEAVDVLEALSAESLPPTLASSTQVLFAEALASGGQIERAIEQLQTVADTPDSIYPPEQALLRLAQVYADEGEAEQAREVLRRITQQYPQSAAAMEANSRLGSARE